jgi:hypothetical protein
LGEFSLKGGQPYIKAGEFSLKGGQHYLNAGEVSLKGGQHYLKAGEVHIKVIEPKFRSHLLSDNANLFSPKALMSFGLITRSIKPASP